MHVRNERGIALALSIFAIVIIGALVSGAFYVGRIEQQTGNNTFWAAQAGEAAEAGLTHAIATWDNSVASAMPIYTGSPAEEVAIPVVSMSPGLFFADTVRRLNQQLYLIRSSGVRRAPATGQVLATTTVGMLLRLAKPTIGVNAAVTVGNPIKLNGNALLVSGYNAVPAQWAPGECPALDPGYSDDVVGVRSATGTGISGNDLNNVQGYPTKTVADDPTVTSATFQDFLDFTYATLSTQPQVKKLPDDTPYNNVGPVVDASTVPATCDKAAPYNFGEPRRNPPDASAKSQCYGYFPVVHGTGSQTKFGSNSRGQGTLLVDGDLELVGGFEWTGLIIVRGKMKINGNGNKITGAILSEGVDLTSGSFGGNVQIHYSKCAIDKAVGGASVAMPLGQRSWTQLY